MNSTITLINGTKITPERNFKLPDMSYVENSGVNGKQEITKFMYIKHSLNLTIKVDIEQYHLEYIFANDVNYIIIKNDFTNQAGTLPKKVGYFVVKKRWVAQETIEYTLLCDVVNSFNDSVEISDKTRILRQHKDRWKRELVSGTAHIGDLITHPKSYFDYGTYDELLIQWFQQTGITSKICFLYDLSEPTIYLESGDYGDVYEIYFGYSGMSAYDEAKYYFVDENFNIISRLTSHSASDSDKITIVYGTSGYPMKVSDDSSGSTIETTIPSNAKYIALCGQTLTEDYSSVYVQIADWDDLTEAQFDEASEKFEDYYKLIQLTGNYYSETQGSNKIIPIIDRYSENISPMLYGSDKHFLQEKGQLAPTDWYLIYKNQNDPSDSLLNPVDCFICASHETSFVQASGTSGTYNQTAIWKILAKINGYSEDEVLLFQHDVANGNIQYGEVLGLAFAGQWDNNNCQFTISSPEVSGTYTLHSTTPPPTVANNLFIQPMRSTQPNRIVLWIYLIPDFDEVLQDNMIFSTDIDATDNFSLTFTNGKVARICSETSLPVNQGYQIARLPQAPFFLDAGAVQSVYGIGQVDRTDPKLIKIIKLPYCPANVVIDNDGYLRFSDEYNYDVSEHMLKVNRLSTTFSRILDIDMPLTAWSNAFAEYDYSLVVQADREKSYEFETKLFHSDYYLPKIIYDSYTFVFQLELMTNRPNDSWKIQFNVSNTINSRFMFTFLDYVCEKNEVRDYNNIMYVARNNDCVIFNQQYINYIRTGYNYDKKSLELLKEKLDTSYNFGIASGAVSSFGSSLPNAIGGNVLGVATKLANWGISMGEQSVMNNYAKIEAEMQLEAKKVQLQNQSTGVMDANDVDLLNVYSRNKLALKFYEVSPRMKKALFNLFYYCGYICEEQGIPDTTSRLRFNYVQAEIVFVKTPNLPQEMIDHLKDLYKLGITFLHAYNGQIDYDQKYENWEVSILDN